ncbi:ABC transporter permease [Leptospira bandrabouensis]|uniref:ABC transporter permease n=1 Tax=Leptospira bandrabouensis TaxID=2484903 RepID=A0A6H3NLI7_9LEPT|nr:ABC transporter permease [Leptospira bandrabouensis]MCG6143098.1 ABC transporter permease [Leptospira bandrabouensis]MCG6151871.1 ABC transporter permease [Leptospira bandrabouensis]MCG6158757.1 ABC transporter permease [Leptospira bandrabouensis]MCG6162693.1 ABC transporter permease [Leptospira bandrabouensis]MCW7459766.1 ABC transporter permease [Leptospira bandrabouensis]
MEKVSILWALVRRDYALQYAGSFLGISWMFLQNLVLISLYALVFLVLNLKNPSTQEDFTAYLLTGLLYWIPIQELLVRGTGILTDNRSLLKRSSLGIDLFLWIPYVQFLIHSLVTSIPVFLYLAYSGKLNLSGIFLGYLILIFSGLYLMLLLHYLSRLNILLKDISPLIRLVSQLLFWGIPVLYYPTGYLKEWNRLNPFTIPLDIFRTSVIPGYTPQFDWIQILPFLLFFYLVYLLSKRKFQSVILDHL